MPSEDFSHVPEPPNEQRARFWASWGATTAIAVGSLVVMAVLVAAWWLVTYMANLE